METIIYYDEYLIQKSLQEKFELFWEKYPKKVGKKPTLQKFKKITDFKNLFLGLDLYCEKWKIEEKPKEFIPNPLTFLNQERYYDEIIIDESKKDKYKKILEQKKEIKQQEKQEREATQKRQALVLYYNSLTQDIKDQIIKEAENIIQKQNPKLFEKKGVFYDNYKKIIIRSILSKMI